MSERKKKVFTLILCIALTFTFLTGCTGEVGTQQRDNETTAGDNTEVKKETLGLRYFYFWENKGVIDTKQDMVSPVIEDKFAIEFEEIINPTASGEEKFRLMITSGDIPDISLIPFSSLSMANKFATEGIFLELTDYVDDYSNLSKLYTPYTTRTLSATDGKVYSFPSGAWETAKDVNYNKEGMWIKKSILDQLGLKQTDLKTPEDLFDICMRIKNEIKEYNDKPIIPYGLGAEGWGDSKFFLMYGADWHNLMPDGKSISFLPTHPGAKKGLSMIYRMMNAGLIEPDAFIQKDDQWREKLAQGRFGMIMHAPSIVYGDLNPLFEQNNPGDTYVPMSFPWGEQLPKYFRYPDNPRSVTLLSAKIKEPERVIEMIDWTASDEGYTIVQNGTEGVFYNMENGKIMLTPAGEKAKTDLKLQEAYGLNDWFAFAGYDDVWKRLGGLKEEDARIKEASDIFATYMREDDGTTLQPNPDTTCAPRVPFRNDGWAILFPIWKDAQAKAIYAETEEEAMEIWDKAVETMNKQAAERMKKEFEEEYQNQLQILIEDKEAQEEAKRLVESGE